MSYIEGRSPSEKAGIYPLDKSMADLLVELKHVLLAIEEGFRTMEKSL